MSESKETALDIAVEWIGCHFDQEEARSELRSLRAEAEAWRAVRERSDARESHYKVHHEVLRQIARLDAMKEGESNGNS